MEDRKRPAVSGADDIAPPSKRQAVNGTIKSRDEGDSRDDAWIEDYQKDAIYRQMLEYRRQKQTLESRLDEVTKRATDHDNHLRIIDQWFNQLLEEIEVLATASFPPAPDTEDDSALSSTALLFKDSDDFQAHLKDRSSFITSKLRTIFGLLNAARDVSAEVSTLEAQVNQLLATQKDLIVRLDRSNADKEALSEQLDTATLRYVKAEKKLDRAKSVQVQKVEQQALANATARSSTEDRVSEQPGTNGNTEALQLKYDEAAAVMSKQKEQLAAAKSEIKALQEENTSLKSRKEGISDEEYSRTELFKQFRAQSEDLIKRVNTLETVNKQLREEAEKLQSERTTYREQLNREAQTIVTELEDQVQQKDQDLTRIRSARDELVASLAIQKAKGEQEITSLKQMEELLSAKDDRISGLELELDRWRPSPDASKPADEVASLSPEQLEELKSLSTEDLLARYTKLSRDFALIESELPSIEKAYRKMAPLAQKRVNEFATLEAKVANLTAEKNKAEQKYFAARRDTDARISENKNLQTSNKQGSIIISQLKDGETQLRTLLANLEKQLADLKQANITILEDNRKLKSSSAEAVRDYEKLKSQAVNVNNLVKAKDTAALALKEKMASHETELAQAKVRLEHAQKERDNYKSRGSSDSEENLRKFALCNVCNSNFKNVVIKTCGHVFCKDCVDSRLVNRRRKCPTCSKAFDKMDVMQIHM